MEPPSSADIRPASSIPTNGNKMIVQQLLKQEVLERLKKKQEMTDSAAASAQIWNKKAFNTLF